VALIGLVLRGLLAPLLLRVFGEHGMKLDEVDRDLLASLGCNGVLVLIAVLFVRQRGQSAGFAIGLDGSRRGTLLFEGGLAILGLVAIAPVFVASFELKSLVLELFGLAPQQAMVQQLLAAKDKLHDAWIVLGIGTLIPFCEEILFRGLLLRGLVQVLRPGPAILASALFFAVMHDPSARVPVFVLGVLFGLLYVRTRSIFAPFVAHALFNTAQLLLVIPNAQ
jgi:membrane protease YdiL (CAAX protease family)